MKNLTLEHIAAACHGTYYGSEEKKSQCIEAVTTDSRKVERGCLFVPIVGARADGHKFIDQVMKQGALATLSERPLGEVDFPYIQVESSLQAVKDLAAYYLEQLQIPVVGITGSVGKTSTKEMIASVVAQKYNVHKTIGNFNNEWGLPITIFEMNESHQVAILEMGVNHFGEMRRLSSVASPDICVITNIGVAHLEFFKTREGILQEKSQMIQDMKDGGTIILNGDDDLLSRVGPIKGVAPIFFGLDENNQFYADQIQPLGLRGTSCTIHLPDDTSFECIVPLPGKHMIFNALAGTAVGYTLGLTPEEIKAGIEGLPSIPGRNNIIKTDRMIILDDCYNANPISMKASIDVLDMAIGRKIAVLGDMGELGEKAGELHREVGEYAASHGIDLVCGIGDLSKELVDGALKTASSTEGLWFATKADFLDAIRDIIKDGDNILVKASHGMNFPEIVDALKNI